MLEIKVVLKLEREYFETLFVSAFEGGVNYWCDFVEPFTEEGMNTPLSSAKKPLSIKLFEHVMDKDGYLMLGSEEDGEFGKLSKKTLTKGIKRYIKNNPGHDITDPGNVDADVADAIMQYAVFGDVVYG